MSSDLSKLSYEQLVAMEKMVDVLTKFGIAEKPEGYLRHFTTPWHEIANAKHILDHKDVMEEEKRKLAERKVWFQNYLLKK